MHAILTNLIQPMSLTGDLKSDVHTFLTANGSPHTATHCMEVGSEARRLAERFHADPEAAEIAGWLHDISTVIPNHERIEAARQLQVDILPEEERFPMIIHQKLSKVMARDIFKVTDEEILNAISCHTTLRAKSTLLDQVVFVADKIAWDQTGTPPYIDKLTDSLNTSLARGAFAYINYLWERKETLRVVHPWLKDAYEELVADFGG
ncbi:putative HD superfamily hydrolase of NAD metabolism [Paenibacillus sp. UNCCL117]|uniref:bis(5'-nucleosyl)-tetraphosphatase (symmetrical) YqeK n=1 Tax=unclassified Paenibacillus TaxID=185978 RepID=UPI00087F3031|nr:MULTISPECIES: bis(5'-nucleosyl)-tetraphosphatase (symmetrical) YqeK [unclassified Paenibacillus]SDE44352.1 putative HD superfamily hydrolase of NAD metabolism [Paenibacillus sp. cl123]SFW46243.1 putative HD superfamily hydrolase of NAD metabolism [Paenibacillus sp. UNCCL117]